MVWIARLSLLAFLFGWALAARADSGEEKFLAAHERYEDKEYDKALPLFREAHAASGSPNALLYVARCLRELGQVAEAYEQMQTTVRDATARANDDEKYAETRNAAAAELAQLEPRVAKLVIVVHEPPTGMRVVLNGGELDPSRLGKPVAVAPGHVVVEASAPDRDPLRRELDLNGGASESVSLRFEEPAPPPAAPIAPPPEPASTSSAVRTAGFVVGGLGVVGLVAFAVTGVMAKTKFDEVDDACGGARCTDPAYDDEIDQGKRLAVVANAMAGIGAAATIAGVFMIIFGGPAEKTGPEAALRGHPPPLGRLAMSPRAKSQGQVEARLRVHVGGLSIEGSF